MCSLPCVRLFLTVLVMNIPAGIHYYCMNPPVAFIGLRTCMFYVAVFFSCKHDMTE